MCSHVLGMFCRRKERSISCSESSLMCCILGVRRIVQVGSVFFWLWCKLELWRLGVSLLQFDLIDLLCWLILGVQLCHHHLLSLRRRCPCKVAHFGAHGEFPNMFMGLLLPLFAVYIVYDSPSCSALCTLCGTMTTMSALRG